MMNDSVSEGMLLNVTCQSEYLNLSETNLNKYFLLQFLTCILIFLHSNLIVFSKEKNTLLSAMYHFETGHKFV